MNTSKADNRKKQIKIKGIKIMFTYSITNTITGVSTTITGNNIYSAFVAAGCSREEWKINFIEFTR